MMMMVLLLLLFLLLLLLKLQLKNIYLYDQSQLAASIITFFRSASCILTIFASCMLRYFYLATIYIDKDLIHIYLVIPL